MSFEFTKLSMEEQAVRMLASFSLSRVYDPAHTMNTIMNNLAFEAQDATSIEELLSLIRSSRAVSNKYFEKIKVQFDKIQKQLTLQEGTE